VWSRESYERCAEECAVLKELLLEEQHFTSNQFNQIQVMQQRLSSWNELLRILNLNTLPLPLPHSSSGRHGLLREEKEEDEDEEETEGEGNGLPYDSSKLWGMAMRAGTKVSRGSDGNEKISQKMNGIVRSLQGTINGILGRAVGAISALKIDKYLSFRPFPSLSLPLPLSLPLSLSLSHTHTSCPLSLSSLSSALLGRHHLETISKALKTSASLHSSQRFQQQQGLSSELLKLELSANHEALFRETPLPHRHEEQDQGQGQHQEQGQGQDGRREIPLKLSPRSISPQEYGALALLSNVSLFIPSSVTGSSIASAPASVSAVGESSSERERESGRIYLPIGCHAEPMGCWVLEIEDIEDKELISLKDEIFPLIGSHFCSWLAMGELSSLTSLQEIQLYHTRYPFSSFPSSSPLRFPPHPPCPLLSPPVSRELLQLASQLIPRLEEKLIHQKIISSISQFDAELCHELSLLLSRDTLSYSNSHNRSPALLSIRSLLPPLSVP
jgi:hypothetical protein